MKKILIVGYFLLICFINYAQTCNDAIIDTMRGSWKIARTGSIPSFISKVDIQKEKILMESANETIKKSMTNLAIGGDIFQGVFWVNDDPRPNPVIKACNNYYSHIVFKKFHCYEGKVNGDGLYGDREDLYLFFNELPFTFGLSFYIPGPKSTGLDLDPRTDVYGTLRSLPEVKDGYFDFLTDAGDGTGKITGDIYRYRTIIKQGKLPYIVMSKKEYYEKWKIKYRIEIENSEADKTKYRKELAGNNQLDGILKQSDQYIELYQNYIKKIDDFLKNKSADELSKPAYEGEEEGTYFESLERSGSKNFIVKPNYAYYNDDPTKKYNPQLITICFKYYLDIDAEGNKKYSCQNFYKSFDNLKIFDMLSLKFRPLIVQ